jgi:uncharacterized membrane protein YfcA
MEEWSILKIACVSFALATGGFAKGVVGIGLPLTAISLMSPFIDAHTAVGLMPVPILFANIWQAFHGGPITHSIQRFWLMMVFLPVGTVFGVKLLSMGDKTLMSGILGSCIVIFSLFTQYRPQWRLSPEWERLLRPVVGLAAGFIGGVSSFYGPPMIIFLISLRLSKEVFVKAIGLAFFVGIISMIISLAAFGVLGPWDFFWSGAAAGPTLIGLLLGQYLRNRIPEKGFRRILVIVFLLSGINLIRQALA